MPHITTAERTNAAEIVLEGTVVDGTNQQGKPEYPLLVVKVQVQQYLKGGGPAVITIDGFGQGSLCLAEARIGDHLIFYATGDPREQLHAHYVSQFDAVQRVDAATIAEISAAAQQTPIIPAAPILLPEIRAAAQQTPVIPAAPGVPPGTTNWLPARWL